MFDSAFLRRQVVTAWERFGLKSPVYVSEEDLRALSKFALSRGLQPTRPLIVRTDTSRIVTNISVITKPGEAKSALSNQAAQSSAVRARLISERFKIWDWTFTTSIRITACPALATLPFISKLLGR